MGNLITNRCYFFVVAVLTWLSVLEFTLRLSLWRQRSSWRVTEVVAVAFRVSCHTATAMSHDQYIETLFWSTSCSHSSKKILLKIYIAQILCRLTDEGPNPFLRYCHLIPDCGMVTLCCCNRVVGQINVQLATLRLYTFRLYDLN
jgi:hypothetical protein